jgi:hypothetical protein
MAQPAESSGSSNEVGRSGSIYSFGETDLAAQRLRVVAEVFDPTSEAFLSETVRKRPGGLLLVEELDSISTTLGAFDEYLKIVSQMLARHGNKLFVGARLANTRWNTDLWIDINRATEVRPTTRQAARMFSLNLSNWRHDPYVKATYPSDKLESLAIELDGLTDFVETGQIIWQMRQICLRRKI